jgi:Mor family transcriptional regulator
MAEFGFMDQVEVRKPQAAVAGHDDLPPVLQEIERLIGLDLALKLVDGWGGLNLYIPEKLTKNHRLSRTIGLDAAQRLSGVYGGDTIIMPRAHQYKAVQRQIEVYTRHKAGEPVEKLAALFNVTWRAIYIMISRETTRRAKIRYNELMRERGRKVK